MGVGASDPWEGQGALFSMFWGLQRGTLSRFGSGQLVNVPWNKLAFQLFQNSRQDAITVLIYRMANHSHLGGLAQGLGGGGLGAAAGSLDPQSGGKLKTLVQDWLLCWVLGPLGS